MRVGHYVKFFLKNLIRMITLVIGVSIAAFALVSASPIDPVKANVGTTAYLRMSDEKKQQLESYWGKDRSPVERYFNWAGDFIRGDMGMSLKYNRPVSDVIGERFGNSFLLMLFSWIIAGAVGILLGVIAGYFKGRAPDLIIKGYSMIMASTPAFWVGLVILLIFAVALKWFPTGMSIPVGVRADQVGIGDIMYHMFLPALTLSLTGMANIILHTREKMIDIMQSDHIRFARARGESSVSIVKRHALRNILLPAITLQFASISEIFGGSVLVEQVFSYPGLGQAAVNAGIGGDVSLLLAIAIISTAIVCCGNLIANSLYGIIDPQIRRGRSHG